MNNHKNIAIFMGLRIKVGVNKAGVRYYYHNCPKAQGDEALPDYEGSWDALMPVVKKVEETLAAMDWEDEVPLEYDEIYNCLVNVDLPGVYKAVIGFINWHFEECNKTEYDGN